MLLIFSRMSVGGPLGRTKTHKVGGHFGGRAVLADNDSDLWLVECLSIEIKCNPKKSVSDKFNSIHLTTKIC